MGNTLYNRCGQVLTRGRAHTTEKWALKNTLNIFGVDNFLLTLLFKQAEWVAKRH